MHEWCDIRRSSAVEWLSERSDCLNLKADHLRQAIRLFDLAAPLATTRSGAALHEAAAASLSVSAGIARADISRATGVSLERLLVAEENILIYLEFASAEAGGSIELV